MLMLFLVFMLIMATFSLIVYTQAEDALYEELDQQMIRADQVISENVDDGLNNILNGSNIIYTDKGSYIVNYKIFLLLRDDDGNILNSEHLSYFDYMLNIGFSPKNDGHLRTEKAERNSSTLHYRTFTRQLTDNSGNIYYLQMVSDSTEIQASLSIIKTVLFNCTLIAMFLVVIVGWYLSKKLVSGVEEAWERQDEFISYASHELRTPLAVIHSSLELLLETPGKKIIDRSDLIMNSLSETSRLRKMSSNLLEMVQIQASQMTLKPETINVRAMIDDFIEPFCYQAQSAEKTLEYWVAPSLVVVADRHLLTEVIVILLENALKYTSAGDYIRIIAEERNGKFEVRVLDSGITIPTESLEKIFNRFYRENQHQSKADGSGLGLYIARLIAQLHNGDIKASHNEPKGVVFTLTIPLKRKI